MSRPLTPRLALAMTSVIAACGTDPSDLTAERTATRSEALSATSLLGMGLPAKTLSLTFDDGPGYGTSAISAYLAGQGIPATFFVNGAYITATTLPNDNNIPLTPNAAALLAQLVADGHLVANHATTHRDLNTVLATFGATRVIQELAETDTDIAASVPSNHFLFRAPYGAYDGNVWSALAPSAMSKYVGAVGWDIGGATSNYPAQAADWACWVNGLRSGGAGATFGATPQQCGDAYLAEITAVGRGIVLMHDSSHTDNGGTTLAMVQYIVPILKARGYSFVRADGVPEIAALLPPVPCDASCAKCNGAGPSRCTSCSSGAWLSGGSCRACTACGAGSYQAAACTAGADACCVPCAASSHVDGCLPSAPTAPVADAATAGDPTSVGTDDGGTALPATTPNDGTLGGARGACSITRAPARSGRPGTGRLEGALTIAVGALAAALLLFRRRRLRPAGLLVLVQLAAWAGVVIVGCSATADTASPGADAPARPSADVSVDGSVTQDAADALDAGAAAAPDARADAVQPPDVVPDSFLVGAVDVVTVIRTSVDRQPISPLIYGINGNAADDQPAALLKGVTLVRRGGDRGNSYNWETNVSNGSFNNGFTNDMALAAGLPDPNAPAGQDLAMLAKNRPAGRATMVPFVLGDFVSGPVAGNIPWDQPGFNRALYFDRVGLVKPTPFATTPALGDGVVYTDEHLAFMMSKFADDITAPGPGKLIVGIDNEPDLYHSNFPMLQAGTGDPIFAPNGTQVGRRVTGAAFTQRMITFAKSVRAIAPAAQIVGPSHYHFDGFTMWHQLTSPVWSDNGRWYMDDFLADVKAAGNAAGTRLLDTWDFHWYPQPLSGGTYVWDLDDATRAMTPAEIDAVVQGPRSYWDATYDEGSWITAPAHLAGPASILTRVRAHLDAGYPGTKLGISEYFPGGRNHISSGLATVDSLGVFQRMGVDLAAMWPVGKPSDLAFAFGGIQLIRNADGNGLRYADTTVRVEHPEIVESSVYAGSDVPQRVTVLVVNKTHAPRTFGLRVFDGARLSRVDVFRIDAGHSSPYLSQSDALTKVNAYAYAAPPMSAAMLVFRTP